MKNPESILVLGSAGFVGSAVCSHLVKLGHKVLALGRSEIDREIEGMAHVRGSIEDRQLLRDALARSRSIVYCAAMTTPGTSAHDPALEVLGNLLPLSRVLECAVDFPGRRVVYLSSGGAVYGDDAADALESNTLRPRSYYGAGKAAAEALIHACVATSDWSAVILRPSNLYGPGQRVTKGFAIIPTLFDRISDGKAFQVWGDGSTVRDYCYIDDLASAVTSALRVPLQSTFNVYNVASREAVSIRELIEACQRASDGTIKIEHRPARNVDVACVSPNPKRIADELEWRARIGLEEGLRRTWQWHQSLLES